MYTVRLYCRYEGQWIQSFVINDVTAEQLEVLELEARALELKMEVEKQ